MTDEQTPSITELLAHRPFLEQLALRLTGERESADDLVHDTGSAEVLLRRDRVLATLDAAGSVVSSLGPVSFMDEEKPVQYEASCRLVRVMSFLVLLASGSAAAQGDGSIEHLVVRAPAGTHELARIELEGFVYDPAGVPAEGVVVVSSAGGKALTDRDGAYRLDVPVPAGTSSVQVTAVGTGGLVASTPAMLPSGSRSAVPPLWLALGNSCSPSWLPTFGGTGTGGSIAALAVYDDGDGPALHAAGSFLSAGGVPANRIAKWDGSSWKALAGGLNGTGQALAVHDDGSGPALFVGGAFTTAGGRSAARIAKWNGTTWAAVGGGIANGYVDAFGVFDDGGGPALYVGGSFTSAGGVAANKIARWNGTSWSALGAGMSSGFVSSLAVHDDGGGPALYAAGSFSNAGGVPASSVARWNGTSWSALGYGLSGTVYALAFYDDGSGAALYAGGYFGHAGGLAVNHIARWTGSTWAAVGSGFNDAVRTLRVFGDGSGARLWAGGDFEYAGTFYSGTLVNRIAAWDGSSWQASGSGMEGGSTDPNVLQVLALCSYDDGDGTALVAGGRFARADGVCVNNIARQDGSSWDALGSGGVSAAVRTVATYDDGTGPALYAGGDFVTVDGVALNHIGRWDGWSWTPLGSGMDGSVFALVVHDDGSGPALFAGGSFTHAGGVSASRIAKWDGSSWSDLDLGVSPGDIRALAVHDDGGGPALYAGGTFLIAGGGHSGTIPVNRIAKWDGTAWDNLGTGVNTQGGVVSALISHNDGSGQKLFAGGWFGSIDWVVVSSIARWNGSTWANVGGGVTGGGVDPTTVDALAVYGGSLYAGGNFAQAGGVWAFNIARWNGTSWFELSSASLPSGLNDRVWSLSVHDDGNGAKLHAGGSTGIARWSGSAWTALGGGGPGPVLAMTTFDYGIGPSLLAGGEIGTFVDSGDSFLGEWGCDRQPPMIFAPPVYMFDRGNGLGEVVTFSVVVSDDHDPSPTVSFSPPSGSWFPRGTTLVTCTATDDWGNQFIAYFPVTVYLNVRPR